MRAERVAKMRGDVQRERDAIAALRAEWTTLENPARIQGLARRHLRLRPAEATQYDALDRLPERPPHDRAAAARRRDRREDRRLEPGDRQRAGTAGAAMTAMDAQPQTIQLPADAARQSRQPPAAGCGTLLYGRNVDRTAKARARVGLAMLAFAAVYAVIAVRLVMFAVVPESHFVRRGASRDAIATARPDILDRNGMILATDVRAPSLFAEPRKIIDVDEATELLTAVLPDLDPTEVRDRIGSRRGFVWLKREITPKQRQEIYKLGLPGVGFLAENKRVYPNSAEVSHLIGHVNIDNQGIAGIEKWLDGHGLQALHLAGLATDRLQKPVELAVDLRVQHALRDELIFAAEKYKVKAAAGLVVDVETGEIVSMVSLPDYDPNSPKQANDPLRINRLTTGVFELGSTFKALTLAMALDSGKYTLNSMMDARVRAALRALHDPRLPRAESHAQPCRRCSPIRRTSAPRAWRWAWASSITSGSCGRWASSTGCAPSCRKAPSRSCPSAGASSTP